MRQVSTKYNTTSFQYRQNIISEFD